MPEILAKVIRGETIESVHRGHLIVVDGEGKTIAQIGEPETVTFWRSAAKSFQILPCILSGAADAFGFSEQEIAIGCASHSGEDFHTKTVQRMLDKIGLSESDLRCGAHPSFNKETAESMIRERETPTQLNNNCSGKHAAMLAFAKHTGADLESYLSNENSVQQAILEIISRFTGISKGDIKFGVDGCSAPNFGVPISSMAKAFSNLTNPRTFSDIGIENACLRIVAAQMKYPEYVGGSVRLDTKIMKALEGKLICKVGAEGVWCAGVLPSEKWKNGLGIAIKIEDGDDGRARPVAAIELLRQLGIMTDKAENVLGEFSPIVLKNRMETIVGKVVADIKT